MCLLRQSSPQAVMYDFGYFSHFFVSRYISIVLSLNQCFLRPRSARRPFFQGTVSPRNLASNGSANSTVDPARRLPELPLPGHRSFAADAFFGAEGDG